MVFKSPGQRAPIASGSKGQKWIFSEIVSAPVSPSSSTGTSPSAQCQPGLSPEIAASPICPMQNYRAVASLNVSGSRTMVEKIWDLQFLLAALGADPAGWVLRGPARRLLLSWPPPWPSSPCFTGRYFNRSRADGKSKSCQSSSLLLNHVQIQVISEDPT